MTVMHGWGKFSHLLFNCNEKQPVRHSIIPSGIVYEVPWSSSVVIMLWLYICNLLTRLLAWEEQTGQDSMSSHHLKMLTRIKHQWLEGTTLPYTLIHFKPLRTFLLHLHSCLTLHVQRLYCPHKLLSCLSLCLFFYSFTLFTLSYTLSRSMNASRITLFFSLNCFLHNLHQTKHLISIRPLSP